MQNAAAVQVRQGRAELGGEAVERRQVEVDLVVDDRDAVDDIHGEVALALVGEAVLAHADDVRMPQARGDLELGVQRLLAGALERDELEGHDVAGRLVARPVHLASAPGAQTGLEAEAVDDTTHGGNRTLAPRCPHLTEVQ